MVGVLVDEVVLVGEVSVLGVLDVGVHPSVSNGGSLEVEVDVLTVLNDFVRDGGDVVPGVGLSSDEEFSALVLRVLSNEALQEGVESLGDTVFGLDEVILGSGRGEASANWVVNVHHVGILMPRVLVGLDLVVLVESVRSVLHEHGDLRGAAGASSQPHDQGSVLLGSLEQPVEHRVSLVGADINVARGLVNSESVEGGGSSEEGQASNDGKKFSHIEYKVIIITLLYLF